MPRSTSSPAGWPKASLYVLNWSTSSITSESGNRWRVARAKVRLQRLEEAAAVLQSGQLVGRGQLAQSGVLPLQILLHGEQAAGDLQAGDQLPRIERLGQEIVDPGGQGLQVLLAPAPAGEQDEVGVGSPGQAPDAAAQLQDIHSRNHPVCGRHLHATALQQRPGLDAVGRRHDLVAQRP